MSSAKQYLLTALAMILVGLNGCASKDAPQASKSESSPASTDQESTKSEPLNKSKASKKQESSQAASSKSDSGKTAKAANQETEDKIVSEGPPEIPWPEVDSTTDDKPALQKQGQSQASSSESDSKKTAKASQQETENNVASVGPPGMPWPEVESKTDDKPALQKQSQASSSESDSKKTAKASQQETEAKVASVGPPGMPWPEVESKTDDKVASVGPPGMPWPEVESKTDDKVASVGPPGMPWPEVESKTEDKPKKEMPAAKGPDLIAMFPQWADAKKLTGDGEAGLAYFKNPGLDSQLTCQACHGFNKSDTMEKDSLGLVRVGYSIFGADHRTDTKGSRTGHAALGANICVTHFFHGEMPGMNAQQLADMAAFLKTGGDKNHPTSQNVPYDKSKYPGDAPPKKLTGGDAVKGKQVAMTRCISCHGVDGSEAKFGTVGIDLASGDWEEEDFEYLATRVRNPKEEHNDFMPGFNDLRISDQQLLDLLAWMAEQK